MSKILVKGIEYPYDDKIKADMEASGVSFYILKTRLEKKWTLYQAVNTPKGMSLEEFKRKNLARIRSLRERSDYQRLKDKKPHLFDGTPQLHSCSRYVSNDMQNHAIARLKTDIYGNVQLI